MLAPVGRRIADSGSAALLGPDQGDSGVSGLSAGVAGGHRGGASVRAGQAVELNLCQWDGPLALVLHVDALSVLFAFMGSVLGGPRAALFHRIHGARQGRHPLLLLDADLHRRLHRAGVQRQPVRLLSLLGTGRPLLLQPGGLLVHQSRGGQRRAQSAADDAHCRLRPAGSHPGALSPHRQRPVDRSEPWRTALPAESSC